MTRAVTFVTGRQGASGNLMRSVNLNVSILFLFAPLEVHSVLSVFDDNWTVLSES